MSTRELTGGVAYRAACLESNLTDTLEYFRFAISSPVNQDGVPVEVMRAVSLHNERNSEECHTTTCRGIMVLYSCDNEEEGTGKTAWHFICDCTSVLINVDVV